MLAAQEDEVQTQIGKQQKNKKNKTDSLLAWQEDEKQRIQKHGTEHDCRADKYVLYSYDCDDDDRHHS